MKSVFWSVKHHRSSNVTGTICIAGSPSGGHYKSKLERHGLIRWFMDPRVKQVILQAPRIRYLDAARQPHQYTGDLSIDFHSKTGLRSLIVEIKYAKELKDNSPLVTKHTLVEAAFRESDRDFIVQTEHEVYGKDFPMLKFAFEHRNNPPHGAEPEILARVKQSAGLTVGDLIGYIRHDRISQLELVPAIWRLVAFHKIRVDFTKNLDLSAKLHPVPV